VPPSMRTNICAISFLLLCGGGNISFFLPVRLEVPQSFRGLQPYLTLPVPHPGLSVRHIYYLHKTPIAIPGGLRPCPNPRVWPVGTTAAASHEEWSEIRPHSFLKHSRCPLQGAPPVPSISFSPLTLVTGFL